MEWFVSKSLDKRYYVKISANCSLNLAATTASEQEFMTGWCVGISLWDTRRSGSELFIVGY